MEIKKSYVYKSIRKAGIESLFSYQTIFLCLMTIGTISSIAFFWAGEFEVWMIVADILFALFCSAALWYAIRQNTASFTAIINPCKSKCALRYAHMIPFDEMCAMAETESESANLVQALGDARVTEHFIIISSYGSFWVIPHKAVRGIVPTYYRSNIESAEYISITDFQDNKYSIVCDDCCFSKRMRKLFIKNEKSVLRFCNKSSKTKRAFTKVLMPCKRPF